MKSMEAAINNMIDEVRKPVDPEINGSARKAELQSIKQTATDCKELIVERQRLEQMIKDLQNNGGIEEAKDYTGALPKSSQSDWKDIVFERNKPDFMFWDESWNDECED